MNNTESLTKFLETRRSYPPALLGAPYPKREEIESIAQMGLRVPDHKKVEPWRLIALEGEGLKFLATLVMSHAPDYVSDPEKAAKVINLYENAGSVLVMVFAPRDVDGAPEWEQHLSMGAVGVSLVNAAIAHGYGACWMSGFLTECPEIYEYLGIGESEKISGFIHMGTAKSEPPERPRPNLDEKLKFLQALPL